MSAAVKAPRKPADPAIALVRRLKKAREKLAEATAEHDAAHAAIDAWYEAFKSLDRKPSGSEEQA